jgi:hypothetical protein
MRERVTKMNAYWRELTREGQRISHPALQPGLGTKAERLLCPQTGTLTPKLSPMHSRCTGDAEADARDRWKLHLACESHY